MDVVELAAERGVTPLDAMLDVALDDDLETRFWSVLANDDPEAIAWLLPRDGVLLGLADSGAHVSQLCDACFATDLLDSRAQLATKTGAEWAGNAGKLDAVSEILRLLEGGLEDISASRSRVPWGVPFPDEDGHTVYVWFDALPNYISAIGYPGDGFADTWPAALHVIGKDITRFHCVIWPAMLLSAGLELPDVVWGHGFVKIGGGKLSKSEAKQLDLDQLIDRHGPDAFRYFLLREIPWDRDRDFPSVEAFLDQFDERYNSDLANDLGNLLNRTVAMARKYRDGAIVPPGGTALDDAIDDALETYVDAMRQHRLHDGLDAAMTIVRAANGFIDSEEPWKLAREPKQAERLDAVLAALARGLATTAVLLQPFIPAKAAEMWERLGGDEMPALAELPHRLPTALPERADSVLFPRFEREPRSG